MRIIQVNSVCGFGSTGRTVEELAVFLQQNGVESYVAYGHGHSRYQPSYNYGTWPEKKWHALYTRLTGRQGLSARHGTRQLIRYIREVNPDVIHLRNIHGNHINFPMLFSFLESAGYPVVWTLHDCWAFTGVCFHYTRIGCYQWRTGCGHPCPEHHRWLPGWGTDHVNEMFNLKKKYFTSIKKMQLVTVSQWLQNQAEQSFLSKYPVQHIYNWVDQNKFKPGNQEIAASYGIPADKPVVLGVAASWSRHNTKYRDAMNLLGLLGNDFTLVLVGALERGTTFPEQVIHIPYLHNTADLAGIYSAAMVYVHFSVEDTFGKVIAEAMACGTPAIVFNATAIPELVAEGCGHVAEPHDTGKVYDYICTVNKLGKSGYSANCLNRVKNLFNAEKNMEQYLMIYKRIVL